MNEPAFETSVNMAGPTSSSGSPLLSVRGVSVRFGGIVALDGVTFDVTSGQIAGLIGPNGAGKTTVLDLICGKTKATAGSIKFRNRELTKLRENEIVQAGVGRKFQTPSIYDDLTVFENLEISYPRGRSVFGALTFRRDAAVRDRVEEIAQTIFLADQLERRAEFLSHGQKQWLEIGMLLMQEPQLILLDEPVAGMSDAETARTAELLNELRGKHSIMVVEHDMGFVTEIAQQGKVTVLHEGAVLAEGRMDQVQADERVIDVYLGR